MPSRKKGSQQKPFVKRLLDGLLSKKTTTTTTKDTYTNADVSENDTPTNATDEIVSRSSSALKQYEQVPQKQGTSPDPTLSGQPLSSGGDEGEQAETELPLVSANSEFFYSPMYRRYFGLTPPNPRLCNPRLLEDYIDWYINVYMEEELPWQWINVGTSSERVQLGEQEAKEEAKTFASTLSTPKAK